MISAASPALQDLTPPRNYNRTCGKDLLWITLLLSLLFGAFLGSRPLSVPDEGRYTEIPREMVASGDYVTPRLNEVKYFEKPPLMYWLTAASIKAFDLDQKGVNEWVLRLWPAFFAVLGALATFLFGNRFYGRTVGLASVGVLSTSLLYYAHSRILILDMPLAGIIACTLFSLFAASVETRPLQRRLLKTLFFTGCAAAVLTKGLIGLAIPGCVLVLWSVFQQRLDLMKVAFHPLGIAWFLALVLPWHIMAVMRNPEFFDFYIVHEQILRFLTPIHKRAQPFWFFLPIVIFGLFPWLSFFPQTIRHLWHTKCRSPVDIFLALWIGFVFIFFSLSSSKLIPYMVPLLPPLAILVGQAVAQAWTSSNIKSIQSSLYLYLCVASILIIGLPLYLAIEGSMANLAIAIPVIIGLWSLLIGCIALLIFMRQGRIKAILLTMGLSAVGLYLPLNTAWIHLEGRSIQPIALRIKETLNPSDLVISWHRYYQDLPPYIGRKTHVVEYPTELAFGMSIEDVSAWMLSEKDFAKLVQSEARYYLVLRESALAELHTLYPHLKNLQIVMRSGKDILLTNK